MITINIARDGDCYSINEALNGIPYREAGTLNFGEGVFHEKVFCDKKDITFSGAGMNKTVITWSDGAGTQYRGGGMNRGEKGGSGEKMGTFRSYTAFLGGEHVTVENMTIINASNFGPGRLAGQALAAYVDAERATFKNVCLIGHQDTLFCAPLPDQEGVVGGFKGPRSLASRVPNKHYYVNCTIQGDVDFIFGGADAVFENCEIISNDRKQDINGYVTAPSGKGDGLGFVFKNCKFTSNCAPGTVLLGRPWRPQGKTILLNCELGAHIHPLGWNKWNSPEDDIQCYFAEHNCYGPGADRSGREPWSKALTDAEAEALEERIETHIACVTG